MFRDVVHRNCMGAIERLVDQGEEVLSFRKIMYETGLPKELEDEVRSIVLEAKDEMSLESATPDFFINNFFEMTRQRQTDMVMADYNEERIERNELIKRLEEIDVLGAKKEETDSRWLDEAMTDKFSEISSTDGPSMLKTGFRDIDNFSQLTTGTLNIVAARPSVGKTAFTLQLARNLSKIENATVDFFSGETKTSSLMNRIISAEANIEAMRMKEAQNLTEEEYSRFSGSASVIANMNICITQMTRHTVHDIKARVIQSKKERPSKTHIVIIDHLGKIKEHTKYPRHDLNVGAITDFLKKMAIELDVVVILLSQLSRAVEQRQDKRPMLSDLRNSGDIEADADDVWFLYRDDYYDKETENTNTIEVIIAKAREGSLGTAKLAFRKEFQKMVALELGNNYAPPA